MDVGLFVKPISLIKLQSSVEQIWVLDFKLFVLIIIIMIIILQRIA